MCEAAADQRTACTVADRVLCESLDRTDREQLDGLREWSGLEPASDFVAWTAIKHEADRKGVRAHGRFSGEPGAPDARTARLALLLLGRAERVPDAVMFIRDSDNQIERHQGLGQARDYANWSFVVVIGVAHTKRECWVLAAFEPNNDGERSRLAAVRKGLGFDPCIASHELTAAPDSAKRSAKRVLAKLCDADTRAGQDWLDTIPLDTLRQRGAKNGLTAYIEEIQTRLVRLFV